MATETQTGEHEVKRNVVQKWVAKSIDDPERAYRAMFYVALAFFVVTTLFPFYWLLLVAIMPSPDQAGFVPQSFDIQPQVFIEIFQQAPFHVYVFNSFALAIMTTAFVLVLASLAGYVFGRLDFPGKTPLMLGILAISYFPPAAFLVPLFRLFNGNVAIFGLTSPDLFNTPWPMVLPFSSLFMPLSIFILTTFYAQIPDGLEDAARVEGTTRLGALFRVIMPLSAPGVATAGVLTFISVYNEFFFSFLMNNGQPANWAPLLQGILQYQGYFRTPYDLMAAASIVGVLPVAIIVVVAQERIVSGLTAGALKE